jgi:hypothetical protein
MSYSTLERVGDVENCGSIGDSVRMKTISVDSASNSVVLNVEKADPGRDEKPLVKVVKPQAGKTVELGFDNIALLANGWSVQLFSIDDYAQPNAAEFAVRNNDGTMVDCNPDFPYSSSFYFHAGESKECGKVQMRLVKIDVENGKATAAFNQ